MATNEAIKKEIQKKATPAIIPKKNSISTTLNNMLDEEGLRKRFEELLGKRTPQFISAIISLINADTGLQECFLQSPMTIIQSALKAATFDLPIDPALGFAYLVPFNNKKSDGSKIKECTFILGYKGMQQLAMRTGQYKKINVIDIREGELKSYNRLTEDIDIEFIEDDEERDTLPVIGYVGYYRLINGMEKTIYMSKNQILKHEQKYRKGQYKGKGWRDDEDAMCAKTVLRKLIGKWGIMSIDYISSDDKQMAALATAVATGDFDDEQDDKIIAGESEIISDPENIDIDPETGEIKDDFDGTPFEGK